MLGRHRWGLLVDGARAQGDDRQGAGNRCVHRVVSAKYRMCGGDLSVNALCVDDVREYAGSGANRKPPGCLATVNRGCRKHRGRRVGRDGSVERIHEVGDKNRVCRRPVGCMDGYRPKLPERCDGACFERDFADGHGHGCAEPGGNCQQAAGGGRDVPDMGEFDQKQTLL